MLTESSRTEEIRSNIIDALNDDTLFEENLIQNINRFPVSSPEELYSHLFYILCDISVDPPQAKRYYDEICRHRESMEKTLGRKMRFRVALLDYFMASEHLLKNPKIVEIKIYELKTKLALIDPLTELYNRRYLDEVLEREINRSSRHGLSFCLLFLDVDNFKIINDTHGHHIGDEVLRDIGGLIRRSIRIEDIAGRYGGEEFIIVMPETDIEGARVFGNRLLDAVRTYAFPRELRVTLSGGISAFPAHASTVKELLEKSDKALYYSKYSGKDRLNVFSVERRYHFRYDAKLDIVYTFEGAVVKMAHTVNISVSGLSFEAERQFALNDIVEITLLSPGQSGPLLLRGRVIWVKEIKFEKCYRMGLVFQDLGESGLASVKSVLKCMYGKHSPRING